MARAFWINAVSFISYAMLQRKLAVNSRVRTSANRGSTSWNKPKRSIKPKVQRRPKNGYSSGGRSGGEVPPQPLGPSRRNLITTPSIFPSEPYHGKGDVPPLLSFPSTTTIHHTISRQPRF